MATFPGSSTFPGSTLFPGGIGISVVTVNIVDPSDNQSINATNYLVSASATSDTGTIVSATVTINGGTPLTMNLDSASGFYKRLVATPVGFVSILVTATDSLASSATDVVYVANGTGAVLPPTIGIIDPTTNEVFGTSQIGVTADVISKMGIDPNTVQVSVDKGVTWLVMTPPPALLPDPG